MSEHAVGIALEEVVELSIAIELVEILKIDKDRARRWELADQKAKAKKEAKKRKKDTLEVVDHEEVVERNGKRYKKITTYIPYVDLT